MAGETTSESGLAGRYAAALFDLADEAKQLDAVAGELRGLKQLIDESEDLRTLIRSPLYDRDEQGEAMAAVLDKAEISDLTRRFVLVVSGNRRLFALPAIIDAYLHELARRRGEVTAQVTAARALTQEQETALAAALKKMKKGTWRSSVTR